MEMMEEVKEMKRVVFNEITNKYEIKTVKMNRQGGCWITIKSTWLRYPYSYLSAGVAGIGLQRISDYILGDINKELEVESEWFHISDRDYSFKEAIEKMVKEFIGADCSIEEVVDGAGMHSFYEITIDGSFYIPEEDMCQFSIIGCQEFEASVYIEDQAGKTVMETEYVSDED